MVLTTPEQMAEALGRAATAGKSIRIGNAPVSADVTLSACGMRRVLQYEPKDLTISVEAGMKFAELSALLESNQQMIPLDPPWHDEATIGGVLAANLSGPRRRLYGTARDLVIGMSFATVEGKLVQSGGMVVKNVAGLDMAKLLIGSFGTLAVITTANFKLIPIPTDGGTLLYEFATVEQAFAMRDRILKSQLQPAAMDVLNPAAAERCGLRGWTLLLEAAALPSRFEREFGGQRVDPAVWAQVREITSRFLAEEPNGIVARYSTTHTAMPGLVARLNGPAVARAGNGVIYAYLRDPSKIVRDAPHVLEHAPDGVDRWPSPGPDFATMQRIKQMMDPKGLLNQGMLYGRI